MGRPRLAMKRFQCYRRASLRVASGVSSFVSQSAQDPIVRIISLTHERRLGPLIYRVVPRAGYLVVYYTGRVATVEIADQWFEDLESELRRASVEQIMWDSRTADPHPAEVRARIWEWLEAANVLKRSAILVESEMLRVSANLSAVGGRIRLRSFHLFQEAEAWLQSR